MTGTPALELRNVAERLILRCAEGGVQVQSLPPEILRDTQRASAGVGVPMTLSQSNAQVMLLPY